MRISLQNYKGSVLYQVLLNGSLVGMRNTTQCRSCLTYKIGNCWKAHESVTPNIYVQRVLLSLLTACCIDGVSYATQRWKNFPLPDEAETRQHEKVLYRKPKLTYAEDALSSDW